MDALECYRSAFYLPFPSTKPRPKVKIGLVSNILKMLQELNLDLEKRKLEKEKIQYIIDMKQLSFEVPSPCLESTWTEPFVLPKELDFDKGLDRVRTLMFCLKGQRNEGALKDHWMHSIFDFLKNFLETLNEDKAQLGFQSMNCLLENKTLDSVKNTD